VGGASGNLSRALLTDGAALDSLRSLFLDPPKPLFIVQPQADAAPPRLRQANHRQSALGHSVSWGCCEPACGLCGHWWGSRLAAECFLSRFKHGEMAVMRWQAPCTLVVRVVIGTIRLSPWSECRLCKALACAITCVFVPQAISLTIA
jgi:hypothetical protein